MINQGLTLHELVSAIRNVIKEEISAAHQSHLQEKLLTAKETCDLLNITLPTLIRWTKDGLLQEHRKGSRVYYKYGEIMNSLQSPKKYKRAVVPC